MWCGVDVEYGWVDSDGGQVRWGCGMAKKKSIEMEWCAVNTGGWAYGDTMLEALDALSAAWDGKEEGYSAEKANRTCLRLFKFPKGHRPGWAMYCPVWKDKAAEGLPWWLVEDNMREWESGDLPYRGKIVVR